MSDLINQPDGRPTRKLVAGVSTGVGLAVTLVPIVFPALMQLAEVISPSGAATWGPAAAAVVSAILSVLGGGTVSYVVKNRAP